MRGVRPLKEATGNWCAVVQLKQSSVIFNLSRGVLYSENHWFFQIFDSLTDIGHFERFFKKILLIFFSNEEIILNYNFGESKFQYFVLWPSFSVTLLPLRTLFFRHKLSMYESIFSFENKERVLTEKNYPLSSKKQMKIAPKGSLI